MSKKRVFIGSSSEAMELASALKDKLDDQFDCCLWYDGFFTLGNHFFSDLIQKIITFDYAIMVGAQDDRVTRLSNNNEKTAPRDNIYLEYGLFSGFLAPKRVLLLIHENCTAASDLAGMSLMCYSSIEDAVGKAYEWLTNFSKNHSLSVSRNDIELLPTVGIAIGYYDNFVYKFLSKLRDQLGTEKYSDFRLNIYVPSFLSSNVDDYKMDLIERLNLVKDNICGFRIFRDPASDSILELYDIPDTISALFKTVDYIFGTKDNISEDPVYAKMRALDNFCDTLSIFIHENLLTRKKVRLLRYSEDE